MLTRIASRVRAIGRANDGAVAIQMALTLTALLGAAGLATDVGFIFHKQRQMQAAADSAAFSAALALSTGGPTSYTTEAYAVAGQNGFVNGSNGVTVTVHNPPVSPANAADVANSNAVQVIIRQSQTSFLAGFANLGVFNVQAWAVAGSTSSISPCILALNPLGSGVSLTGGTSISAPNCAVASQASISVPCGDNITAKKVYYNGATYSWCTSSHNISPTPQNVSSSDPLAGNSGIDAANAEAVADESLTSPAAPTVPGLGPAVTFSYTQNPPTLPAGCTATGAAYSANYTVTCTPGGTYNFGSMTVNGTAKFTGAATYNFSGTVTVNGGATLTFGNGTFNMAQGLVTQGGSTTTFGAGTFNIGNASSCSYSICNGSTITFGGPSTFVISSGVSNPGGATITFGSGSTNSYSIGASSSGYALNFGGSATTTFADATGSSSVFRIVGNVTESGGACTTFPAASSHDINGNVSLAGGLTLGSGLYAVTGSFLIGANGGGDVWCNNANVGVTGSNVTIAVAGSGVTSGYAFEIGSGFNHVTISSPTSGAYENIAIVGPLSTSNSSGILLTEGASATTVGGAIYFPNGPMTLNGGASIGNAAGECFEIVASQIVLNGGTSIAASQCFAATGSSAYPTLTE